MPVCDLGPSLSWIGKGPIIKRFYGSPAVIQQKVFDRKMKDVGLVAGDWQVLASELCKTDCVVVTNVGSVMQRAKYHPSRIRS